MIPNIELLTQKITDITYPSRTYKIDFADTEGTSKENTAVLGISVLGNMILNANIYGKLPETPISKFDRINGYVDELKSIEQAIYLILNTERYKHIIYSWDYGVELVDLFGKPMPYVISELPRRITEALIQDDRITGCKDFEFEINKHTLHTTFTVMTTMGDIPTELEVEV